MAQPYTTTDDDDLDQADPMTGEYANFVSVGSTQTEFYIDFMQVVPGGSGDDHVLPVRRLLLSPMLVRGLVRAMEQEITNYEGAYHFSLPTVDA